MKKEITLEYVVNIGKINNLQLLSKQYSKEINKLKWKCNKCNYIFEKTLRQIENKPQSKCEFEKEANLLKCDKCRNDYIINYFNDLASEHTNTKKNKHGRFLSTEYRTLKTSYLWECENGHIWDTTANIIMRGFWCPECYGNKRGTLEEMKSIAKKRGGKCLSKEYKNSRTKLLWQCSLKHIWNATPNKIKVGRWCPECKSNLSERLVRVCFETLFDYNFPKIRPEWLKYKKANLELDGYCEELNLAFEHNGSQHYEKAFKSSDEKFKKSQIYDEWKIKKCKERNIKLIIIPPLFEFLKLKQLKEFIIFQCKEQNVNLPPNINNIEINYNKAYAYPDNIKKLFDIKKIAKSKQGLLLSKFYINSYTPLKFKCKNNHIFYQKPSELKNCWCYECSKTRKKRIDEIKNFAKEINLILLSDVYNNQDDNLKWKCPICKEQWLRSYRRVKRSFYNNNIQCKNKLCKNHKKGYDENKIIEDNKKKLLDIKIYAKSRNFECLNDEYIGCEKYTWKCKNIKNGETCNHVWLARFISIKNGRGCQKCAGNMKKSLSKIKEEMLNNNILCISNIYNNNKTPLKVKCLICNIEWETNYSNFKNGFRSCNCK